MPEQFLRSVFDISKIKVGTPVKVIIQYKYNDDTTCGFITSVQADYMKVGSFDEENQPVFCKITAEQLLEEVVRIEVL